MRTHQPADACQLRHLAKEDAARQEGSPQLFPAQPCLTRPSPQELLHVVVDVSPTMHCDLPLVRDSVVEWFHKQVRGRVRTRRCSRLPRRCCSKRRRRCRWPCTCLAQTASQPAEYKCPSDLLPHTPPARGRHVQRPERRGRRPVLAPGGACPLAARALQAPALPRHVDTSPAAAGRRWFRSRRCAETTCVWPPRWLTTAAPAARPVRARERC
jgi:hypothetical protein